MRVFCLALVAVLLVTNRHTSAKKGVEHKDILVKEIDPREFVPKEVDPKIEEPKQILVDEPEPMPPSPPPTTTEYQDDPNSPCGGCPTGQICVMLWPPCQPPPSPCEQIPECVNYEDRHMYGL